MPCFATLIRPKWPSDMPPMYFTIPIKLTRYRLYSSVIFTYSFLSISDEYSSAVLTYPCPSICKSLDSGFLYIRIVFTLLEASLFSHKSQITGLIMHISSADEAAKFSLLWRLVGMLLKFDTRT